MQPKTLLKIFQGEFFIAFIFTSLLKTAICGECDHVIRTAQGVVSIPNYPTNNLGFDEKCTWLFETSSDLHRIKIVFSSFEMDGDNDCRYDSVTFFDGVYVDEPVLGKYCGNKLPPTITSTTNSLLMVFMTDGFSNFTRFSATYTAEPCINCTTGVPEAKRKLTEYFLKTRSQQQHSLNIWRTHITRTAVALFLSDSEFFTLGTRTGEEIAYELSLQLLSRLALGQRIPTKDLALFVNALTVACINPKNFYSIDIVDELRERVNSSNFTNPYFILTLCNAKDTMTEIDVLKLQEQYDARFRPLWTDTQAMIVIALSCIHSQSNVSFDRRILDEMVMELKMKQLENGSIDKLKTTALVVQALLAAGSNFTDFNLTAAIKYILQETNRTSLNFQDIYYTLPIFSSMSLTGINSDHCIFTPKTDSEVVGISSEHPRGRIQIQISVIVDDDKDFIRSWKIKVPTNCSLYQALEIIGSSDPTYKVQYNVSEGKPYIVGISNYQDDTEDGLFWFIYTRPLSLPESSKLLRKSPVDIQVSETDELILWYRSGFWTEVEKSSSS